MNFEHPEQGSGIQNEITMIQNYLSIALRKLSKQRDYALLNVLGLALSIACSILIFALDFYVAVNVLLISALTIFMMVFFNRLLVHRIRRNNLFFNLHQLIIYFFSIIIFVTLATDINLPSSVESFTSQT